MSKDHPVCVRDRLLDAGVAVFSKSGFNGCSVQDITDAAGVPKGSFYNHFASKEILGAAAIDHYWAQSAAKELAILTDPSLTPLTRLRAYFDREMAEFVAQDFTCGCLLGNMTAELSDHSKVISSKLSEVFSCWTGHVAACIAEAQQAGEIRSEGEASVLATFALNAWEGVLLRARIEKNPRPIQQFTEILFSQLLH
jgi:TetR/AcrR family transcriptional repressor of nem operon